MSYKIEDVVNLDAFKQQKQQKKKAGVASSGSPKHKKTKYNNNLGVWKPGTPGALAVCRYQTDGYWQAAMLLFWIKWRWKKPNKIKKNGKEWVIAFAEVWAKEAGLSEGEFKNVALPVLKRKGIIEVATWKFAGKRQTWVHYKPDMLANEFQDDYAFYEMRRQSEFSPPGVGIPNDYVKKKSNFTKSKGGKKS